MQLGWDSSQSTQFKMGMFTAAGQDPCAVTWRAQLVAFISKHLALAQLLELEDCENHSMIVQLATETYLNTHSLKGKDGKRWEKMGKDGKKWEKMIIPMKFR